MSKKIWIFNHYATNTFVDLGGRHFYIADQLIKNGHQPTIFCATTIHNTDNVIDIGNQLYSINHAKEIPYVFINTPRYTGNGLQRIKNMVAFYRKLFPVTKKFVKKYGKPDVILASSVHPLTLVAGIKIAKKLGVPCICEVRDLWPETLVNYGALKRNGFFTKLLYSGEKWIYKKANHLIFTMEGGKDYIVQKGWGTEQGGPIDLNKVIHINNGIDLETFNFNKEHYQFEDEDLNNPNTFKIVYTGSIRKINNLKMAVEIAEEIKKQGDKRIQFLIFGRGPEKEMLEQYCLDRNITNIKFKGFVDKKYIPYVLSKSDVNVMRFSESKITGYGASLNKMFDYFASGKPTISVEYSYDLIKKYKCGVALENPTKENFIKSIVELSKISQEEYEQYCKNALMAARDYDFKVLTKKLEQIL